MTELLEQMVAAKQLSSSDASSLQDVATNGKAHLIESEVSVLQWLADEYGVGTVVCDNCFLYMWGGGYVMEAAQQGYIGYTNCPASWAEVVRQGAKTPNHGNNVERKRKLRVQHMHLWRIWTLMTQNFTHIS